ELKERLLFLEQNIGDTIRAILNGGNTTDVATELEDDTIDIDEPLNQILFGPPGTGKTYHTINKAIAIANPAFDLSQERAAIKEEFDRLKKIGQIVFTTFHQSMSYEDFVEGIKPIPPNKEGENLSYEVEDGIFKRICQTAQTPNQNDFNTTYQQLIEELSNLPEDGKMELKTLTGKPFGISLNSNDNLTLYTGKNQTSQGTLTKEKLLRQINGEKMFIGWEGYFKGVISYLSTKYNYSSTAKTTENFVLIIDEINRGNVSAIFGELITLLEDDKRLNRDEALTVTLPYSKDTFGVPPNLYLIGTMNTADRSVEALDSALRRRFSFTEMPPDASLIDIVLSDISLQTVLETINQRIEILLDKDHLIGHSYFMTVEDETSLKAAFAKKIIPLLQEYFYGDYGKIALVLGEGFCEGKKVNRANIAFAKVKNYDADAYSEKVIYTIKDVQKEDFDIKNALKTLLNQPLNDTENETTE
ncbi:MAG: AAA domain-containing protein, partial [Saprospiraceae bacterium]|nr:AAA domain-containing protein [Saprospiraceae bacterium]